MCAETVKGETGRTIDQDGRSTSLASAAERAFAFSAPSKHRREEPFLRGLCLHCPLAILGSFPAAAEKGESALNSPICHLEEGVIEKTENKDNIFEGQQERYSNGRRSRERGKWENIRHFPFVVISSLSPKRGCTLTSSARPHTDLKCERLHCACALMITITTVENAHTSAHLTVTWCAYKQQLHSKMCSCPLQCELLT